MKKILVVVACSAIALLAVAHATGTKINVSEHALAISAPRFEPKLDLAAEFNLPTLGKRIEFELDDQTPITPPEPGTSWSAAYLYRVTGDMDDRASAGVLNKFKTLTNVFGRGWNLDLEGFGGVTLRKRVATAAILGGLRKKVADQIEIYLGGGWTFGSGQPSGACVGFGVTAHW